MIPVETHKAAQTQTELAVTTLMRWVADAQTALEGNKLDGVARARLGELILNACRFLTEREATIRSRTAQADREAARVARSGPVLPRAANHRSNQ